ncbi:MAG TPA: M55 family metallopeptidase [Acidimicrobiales bacterium]|jgi:D-amino peptidase|nr:M55 family metallopeptidase [Acidimicrobiales bacterium]
MRVFLSCDMEGVAGVVDWSQCRGPATEYETARRLMVAEVNAAIEGAFDGGATEVLVNDSHGLMANLPPDELDSRVAYLSGKHKPLYMMQGLDESYGAVLFVGYHGSIGTNGVLSHTYNPRSVYEVRLNGQVVGEAGVNSLVALAHGVPVALVTGDDVTIAETQAIIPAVEGVVVKEAVTRFSARSLSPSAAREAVRQGARRAVGKAPQLGPPPIAQPCALEVDWLTADMAEMATWVGGVARTAARTVSIASENPLEVFQRFVATVFITRSIVET